MNCKIKEVKSTTIKTILEIDKYIYYNIIKNSKRKSLPVEYQGYLAFMVKYSGGLLERGPQDYKIKFFQRKAKLLLFQIYYTNDKQSEELRKYLPKISKGGVLENLYRQ